MSSDNWRDFKLDGRSPKKIQKTKPLKKLPETDAIFLNVSKDNKASDGDVKSLQISIDTKAKVTLVTSGETTQESNH